MGSTDDYDFRSFPAAIDAEGRATPATRAWILAETQGFHGAHPVDAEIDRSAAHQAADGRLLRGAYATRTPAGAIDPERPVATFSSYTSTLNVGGDALLPVHLISDVTVRPTHRRHGILRRLMTDDLTQAHADGFALAALTVTEATIYGRFGFGLATWLQKVEVGTDLRFRMLAEPRGRCELVDPVSLEALAPVVFAAFHAAHPGSVDRQSAYRDIVSGADGEKGERDHAVRAAAHYDESGAIDGYVVYKVGSWEEAPGELEVVDLVAATDDAYLGLWQLLASIDLVQKVTFHAAPVDDPLRWALSDWRLVKTVSVDDWLWLRVLDVPRAFEARGYLEGREGEVVLEVQDALGFAAGRFRMRVAGGRATVTAEPAASPDLVLDASVLGSLYLGGVDPTVLAAAGRLHERTPGAAARLRALLAPVAPLYGITHF
ncbi:MAG: GNAT family N-acetyltransferase [Herbiconiux sp.]|nr:GNAT family N-acetyltransferase [Herbiconiux sp.]